VGEVDGLSFAEDDWAGKATIRRTEGKVVGGKDTGGLSEKRRVSDNNSEESVNSTSRGEEYGPCRDAEVSICGEWAS